MKEAKLTPNVEDPPPCDCCGARDWQFEFSSSGFDLGYCRRCDLHYVAQMPSLEERLADLESGSFGDSKPISSASSHLTGELQRQSEFGGYVERVVHHAPEGPWLDVGCGTGSLLRAALAAGVSIEGVEMSAERRAVAERITGCRIYDVPVEQVPIEPGSLAAVTMINVFSHLLSPGASFQQVHSLLKPGGVLLLRTSEAGPGLKRHHSVGWFLGDHLHFLGKGTIERYGDRIGFDVVERETQWQPEVEYSRERFELLGPSRWKNLVKKIVRHTPGLMLVLRTVALRSQRDNPLYMSTLVLRKRA